VPAVIPVEATKIEGEPVEALNETPDGGETRAKLVFPDPPVAE
jgi:hypothetical protein